MALRVARGLFRLWLILSVLWIGGVGYVTWQTLPSADSWAVEMEAERQNIEIRALRGKQVGNKDAVAVIKGHAQERAQNLRAFIADVKGAGITSVRAIAEELNRRAILTPRGGQWHATSVVRLMERLAT